jgi:Tol biopolymer transport system component
VLVQRTALETGLDLWVIPVNGDHNKPRPYLNASINELEGRISPDGHWVGYTSDESGRNEVFVQSFPTPGNKKRISTSGGTTPMWRRDGRELYFVTADGTLMATSVTPGAFSLENGTPTRLLQAQNAFAYPSTDGLRPTYAPSADGQRFLVLDPVEDDTPKGIHLLHNWKPPRSSR